MSHPHPEQVLTSLDPAGAPAVPRRIARLEVKDHGTFSYAKDAMSALDAESYMAVTSR